MRWLCFQSHSGFLLLELDLILSATELPANQVMQ